MIANTAAYHFVPNADADALLRELGYNDADRARLLGA